MAFLRIAAMISLLFAGTAVEAAITITPGVAQGFYSSATTNLSINVTAGDDVAIGCFGMSFSAEYGVSAPGYALELQSSPAIPGVALLVKHNVPTSGTENVTVTMTGPSDRHGWCVPFTMSGTAHASGTNAASNEQALTASPDYPSTGTLPSASGVTIALIVTHGGVANFGIDLPPGYTSIYTQQSWNEAAGMVAYKTTTGTTAEDPAGGTLAGAADAIHTGVIYFSAAGTGGNTKAPTIPIALAPVVGPGTVTYRFLESVGPYDGTSAHPGVASYDVRRDNVILSGNVDGINFPITASNSNVQGDPTATTSVGGGSGTSTARMNDVDWTLVGPSGNTESTGGFNPPTSHRILFQSYPYAAGQAISAKLGSLTSPSSSTFPGDYDGAGLCVASGTSANAAVVAVYQVVEANDKAFFVIERATNGATRTSTFASGTGSLQELLMVPAGGGTWEVYRVPSSGPPVLLHTTGSVALGSSPVAGKCVFGLTASSASAVFQNFALRTATPVSVTLNATASTTVEVRARAATSGAASGWSVAQTATGTPLPNTYRKLYTGHYFGIDNLLRGNTYSGFVSAADTLLAEDAVTGLSAKITWAVIEPSNDNFSGMTGYMQDLLEYNRDTYGKPTGFEIWLQNYSGTISDDQSDGEEAVLPAWVHTAGLSAEKSGGGVTYRLESSAAYDHFQDLFTTLLAWCDSEPYCAYISGTETADAYPGFNENVRNGYLSELLDDIGAADYHSIFVLLPNWMNDLSAGQGFFAQLAAYGHGWSGSDIEIPNSSSGANDGGKIWRGAGTQPRFDYNGYTGGDTGDFGSIDYRNVLPYMAMHDQYWPDVTRDEAWNYARDTLPPAMIRWNYWTQDTADCDANGWGCTAHADLVADGLRFDLIINKIENSPDILNRTCPSSFGGSCVFSPDDVP